MRVQVAGKDKCHFGDVICPSLCIVDGKEWCGEYGENPVSWHRVHACCAEYPNGLWQHACLRGYMFDGPEEE